MSGISINPYSNLYEQTATSAQNASASSLNDTLSGDLSGASDEELMDVCKDFEAYFVEQVMKEMKKMIPEDDNKDQSMGQLKDYFEDQMMQEYADSLVYCLKTTFNIYDSNNCTEENADHGRTDRLCGTHCVQKCRKWIYGYELCG